MIKLFIKSLRKTNNFICETFRTAYNWVANKFNK